MVYFCFIKCFHCFRHTQYVLFSFVFSLVWFDIWGVIRLMSFWEIKRYSAWMCCADAQQVYQWSGFSNKNIIFSKLILNERPLHLWCQVHFDGLNCLNHVLGSVKFTLVHRCGRAWSADLWFDLISQDCLITFSIFLSVSLYSEQLAHILDAMLRRRPGQVASRHT